MTTNDFMSRFTAIYNASSDPNEFKRLIGPFCIEMIGQITKMEDEIENLEDQIREVME